MSRGLAQAHLRRGSCQDCNLRSFNVCLLRSLYGCLCLTCNSKSRNITVQNSPALVRRDDASYTSLPPDSRKPPASIDPSSKILSITLPSLADVRSLQMVLYLFGTGLEQRNRTVELYNVNCCLLCATLD
jgi:hypothetical protein